MTHVMSAHITHRSPRLTKLLDFLKTLRVSVRWWDEPAMDSVASSILNLTLCLRSMSDLRQSTPSSGSQFSFLQGGSNGIYQPKLPRPFKGRQEMMHLKTRWKKANRNRIPSHRQLLKPLCPQSHWCHLIWLSWSPGFTAPSLELPFFGRQK